MCYGELGYRLRGKKRLLNIFLRTKSIYQTLFENYVVQGD